MFGIRPQEWRDAFRWTWRIGSIPLLAAVILPLAASDQVIDTITPKCVWKTKFGRECPGCGLTTGFMLIGAGDLSAATESNRASVPLYGAFALNSLIWMGSLIARGGKR